MTNYRVNDKKKIIALREMYKRASSLEEVAAVRRKCTAYGVKFHLLSCDDDTFRRAMSEEFN